MASVDITSVVISARSDGIDQATNSLNKLSDAADRAESSTANLGTTSKKTGSAYADGVIAADKLLANYQKQVDLLGANISQQNAYNVALKGGNASQILVAQQLGAQQDAYKRLASDQAEAIRMNKAYNATLEETGKASGHAASGASGITRELIVLGHEASQGQFSRFGGSMIVLAERFDVGGRSVRAFKLAVEEAGGSLVSVVAPIALVVAGIASIALVIYEMVKGANELQEFNKAMILTGGITGQTRESIESMSESVKIFAHNNISTAESMVLALNATGKFTSQTLQSVSEAALSYQRLTGKTTEEVVSMFEELGRTHGKIYNNMQNTVAEWANKQNDAYHFLSAAQYEHIRLLAQEGEGEKAIIETTDLMSESFNRQEVRLGVLTKIWLGWGLAISGVTHFLRDLGKDWMEGPSMTEQVKKQADEVMRLSDVANAAKFGRKLPSGITLPSDPSQVAKAEADLKAAQDKFTALVQKANNDRTAIEQKAQLERANQEGIAGQRTLDFIRNQNRTQVQIAKDQADQITQAAADVNKSNILTWKSKYQGDKAGMEAAMQLAIQNGSLQIITQNQINADIEAAQAKHHDRLGKIKAMGFADINLEISSIKSATQAQLDANDLQLKSIKDLADQRKINVFEEQRDIESVLQNKIKALKDGEQAELTAIANDIARKGRSATEIKELQNRYVQAYTTSEKAINGVNKALKDNEGLLAVLAGKAADAQAQSNIKVIESIKANVAAVQAKIDAYNRLPESVRNSGITEKQLQDQITQSYIDNLQAELAQTITNNNVEEPIAKARIEFLKQEIQLKEHLRDTQTGLEGVQKTNTFNLGFAARAKEEAAMAVQAFNAAGKEISTDLQSIFGDVSKPMQDFFTAFTDGLAKQTAAQEKLNKVKEAYKDAPEALKNQKIQEANLALTKENTQIAIQSFGDIAGAAQGFFDKQSKGYALMGGISKAFHAAEIALQIASIAPKLAAGAATMFGQGGFAGFAGVAAMVAVMAGLGFASSGGSATPPTSAQRQASNGTGSVLGDSNAKSDSIQKALDVIAKDSGLGLVHFNSMDKSLQQLVAGINGLSSLLVSGTNLTSPVAANSYNTGTAGIVVKSVQMAFGDILGASGFMDKVTGGLTTKITSAIFGGKTSVEDIGLSISKGNLGNVLSQGVDVSKYTDIKKTGGWFSSDKFSTQMQSLGTEVNQQFSMVIQSLADTISASAKVLGVSGDSFNEHLKSFVVDIGQISTKGLTGTQIQEALQAAFSKLGDDMAKFAIQGLDKFQKVGEGYLTTVARIANDLVQVQDVFAVLGKTMNETGMAAVDMSEGLISAFGSIDKLTSATQFFIENFATDAEKLAPVQKSVTDAMTAIGKSSTTTVAQFDALVREQDLSTTAGQQMYATLLNIAPAFKQVADAADKAAKAASDKAAADKAAADQAQQDAIATLKSSAQNDFSVLTKSITTAKNEAQAAYDAQSAILNAQISSLSTVSQNIGALSTALDSALHTMTDNTVLAMTRAQAQSQLDVALSEAKSSGKLPTAESLKNTLATLGKDPAASFSSYQDYVKDQAITANKISALNDIAKTQKSAADQQLETAKAQLVQLKTNLDAEIAKYDLMLNVAQEQLDAMNGTQLAVKDLTTAMYAFNGSVNAAISKQQQVGLMANTGSTALPGQMKAPQTVTDSQIADMYKNILGRTASPAEIAFQHTAAAGWSASDLAQFFYTSPEYMKNHPVNGSHANGLDNVPFDGYTAKLHKGEMVLPAKQAKGVIQGEDMKAVVDAINNLCADNSAENRSLVSDIKWLRKLFQNMAPSNDRLQVHDIGAA